MWRRMLRKKQGDVEDGVLSFVLSIADFHFMADRTSVVNTVHF